MKQGIIEKASICLLRKGYTIKSLKRTAFDILARKQERILLIKVLEDANAIPEDYAFQMRHIASYMGASPLMICKKAGIPLCDNVVYLRCGIYTLNLESFKASLDNRLFFIRSDHAGQTARVIGEKVRRIREQRGISLGDISRKIGVSKKMVQRYESGESNVTVNKALKIYDIFGHSVFDKIDVFEKRAGMPPNRSLASGRGDLLNKYSTLGFKAVDTDKVPFDIIAKKEDELILTKIGDKPNPGLDSLSKLVDADRLTIYKKKKPKKAPSLTKEEFMEFEKARDLIKFLKEFK
ncbi:helix-turn-helix domain-containing protein [Candidatus Woesearchaeota archaeon]|nr:helix-turn-helix domain-containing protein [Candidatus Woesearchaeota archaeon]